MREFRIRWFDGFGGRPDLSPRAFPTWKAADQAAQVACEAGGGDAVYDIVDSITHQRVGDPAKRRGTMCERCKWSAPIVIDVDGEPLAKQPDHVCFQKGKWPLGAAEKEELDRLLGEISKKVARAYQIMAPTNDECQRAREEYADYRTHELVDLLLCVDGTDWESSSSAAMLNTIHEVLSARECEYVDEVGL